ncbi:PEP phosphonomutase-like protein [Streptococcus pneumoniae]|nr:PEP phosphonomutase-like protein [Streptococcus pneumoniae]VMA44903.1 PEP phosphonomutase-like protein [Streptococcus pneumoniae]VMU43996.1 PEP phosphonomutase-like protein [Streptococcus pneumoniae]
MKRLISANPSEILQMNAEELKQSILASEGRVVLSENVVTRETFVGDITNSEIARAFGADMILLSLKFMLWIVQVMMLFIAYTSLLLVQLV